MEQSANMCLGKGLSTLGRYHWLPICCSVPPDAQGMRHLGQGTHQFATIVKGSSILMKKRSFFRRVPVLLFLAAGVSVAVLASREDGREKLSQFGETLGKGVQSLGSAFASAREFAGEYAEKLGSRNETSYPSYTHQSFQQNGNIERKGEYSSAR